MIICIDAGHGGSDSGALNHNLNLRECDVALSVAKKLQDQLKRWGNKVVMTREEDVELCPDPDCDDWEELQPRCDISNNAGADIFVSIHCNACNTEATGIETWYYEGSDYSEALAICIQTELVEAMGWEDRGTKAGRLYVNKNTDCPSVLIELGFIDNDYEGELLANEDVQDRMVLAIAKGITDYENPF